MQINKTELTIEARIGDAVDGVMTVGTVFSFNIFFPIEGIGATVSYTVVTGDSPEMVFQHLVDNVNNDPSIGPMVLGEMNEHTTTDTGATELTLLSKDRTKYFYAEVYPDGTEDTLNILYYVPKVPYWATDDTALKAEPSEAKKETGWELIAGNEGERPPLEYFNWFWNTIGTWFDYTYTAIKEFDKRLDHFGTRIDGITKVTPILGAIGYFWTGGSTPDNPNFSFIPRRFPTSTPFTVAFTDKYVEIGGSHSVGVTLEMPIDKPAKDSPGPGYWGLIVYYCDANADPIGNGAFPGWPAEETPSGDMTNAHYYMTRNAPVFFDEGGVGTDFCHIDTFLRWNHGRLVLWQIPTDGGYVPERWSIPMEDVDVAIGGFPTMGYSYTEGDNIVPLP